MNRNYRRPTVAARWYESRNTDAILATAIHAIADRRRSPESIWEQPTDAEIDHIGMAMAEYLAHGDFPASIDGRYFWGDAEPMIVAA